MKNRCLFILLCILPMLCGCNESDDVVRIFTGKTWKLTDVLDVALILFVIRTMLQATPVIGVATKPKKHLSSY
jgi:hypothetical protein